MKKIVDLQINLDGLTLEDGETIEDFIEKIESLADSNYKVQYQVLYEEEI